MIDSHYHPDNWGIRPVLFSIGNFQIPAYSFFVFLGLIAGIIVYILLSKGNRTYNKNAFYILTAAFVCGTLGAKIPIWIANYKAIFSGDYDLELILSGRTIIGGLIGGSFGVFIVKRALNIKQKMGNQIAPAAALGVSIGRLGCFFRGCCYGIPTNTNWGVDFGDGILRHPTQIYEFLFDFSMFIILMLIRKKIEKPGKLFQIFLNSYFIFRFFIEFIRVESIVFIGLTGFQIACVLSILFLNRKSIWTFRAS